MNAVSYGQIPQTAKFKHLDVYAGGSVPVIEAIIDDQGSRTGDIGNGGYTDDGRPEITGKGNPGDLIHIYDGSELLGRVRVAANGVWTFTPTFPLSDGRHSITILHESDDGDVSDLSEPYVIFVDKVAPDAPSISEVLDDVGPQTGAISNGGGTDDNTPTLSGKGEAGATVTIIDNATVESTIAVSGRTGNAPASTPVTVDISHTWKGDLKVDLVAPDGSVYVLSNYAGGSADDIKQTFSVNLSSEALNGSWKLRVNDKASGDTGRINSWSIKF